MTDGLCVVWCIMGDSKRYCANWSKSMKFGTLIDFNMLYPNLPEPKPILNGAVILDDSKWSAERDAAWTSLF